MSLGSIAREVCIAALSPMLAGEIGVASIKAFTTQIALLAIIGLKISQIKKSLKSEAFNKLLNGLNQYYSSFKKSFTIGQHYLRHF